MTNNTPGNPPKKDGTVETRKEKSVITLLDHTTNSRDFYLRTILNIVLAILILGCGLIFIMADVAPPVKFIIAVLVLAIQGGIYYSLYLSIKYFKLSKGLLLRIAAESDIFQFGKSDNLISYNKADINEINIYASSGTKGSRIFDIIEVSFVNGSKIRFSGMLINPFLFASNFNGITVNYL